MLGGTNLIWQSIERGKHGNRSLVYLEPKRYTNQHYADGQNDIEQSGTPNPSLLVKYFAKAMPIDNWCGTVQHSGGNIQARGIIYWTGRSDSIILEGNLTNDTYLKVQAENVLSIIQWNSVFPDDNVPAHRSLLVREIFAFYSIQSLTSLV